jgi:hypothetical protein
MQIEETGLFARVNRRSRERRGLEAIFSSQKTGRKREVLIGAAGILAGLILSILAILRTNDPQALVRSSNVVYSSLTFGALGVLLLICGTGTLTYTLVHRESEISNKGHPPTDGPSGVDDLGDAVSKSQTQKMFGQGSRIGGVAFIQSLILVALYSGFVQEFESNSTMQIWVRSNFPIGQSLLNWEGVIVLSVVLGLLLLQFLPGRFLSED